MTLKVLAIDEGAISSQGKLIIPVVQTDSTTGSPTATRTAVGNRWSENNGHGAAGKLLVVVLVQRLRILQSSPCARDQRAPIQTKQDFSRCVEEAPTPQHATLTNASRPHALQRSYILPGSHSLPRHTRPAYWILSLAIYTALARRRQHCYHGTASWVYQCDSFQLGPPRGKE